jgi:hypothetical protein
MNKLAKISIFVVVLFFVATFFVASEDKSTTRLFCAYGKIFVEFEESHSTWGTLMLDNNGRPIPCNGNAEIELTSKKGDII